MSGAFPKTLSTITSSQQLDSIALFVCETLNLIHVEVFAMSSRYLARQSYYLGDAFEARYLSIVQHVFLVSVAAHSTEQSNFEGFLLSYVEKITRTIMNRL